MQTIVVFSGAGLSQESGIPTFRDLGGLWQRVRIEDVASPRAWKQDPRRVLDFYTARFERAINCEPNAGHHAIAKLQNAYRVIHITQNVDHLLEKAGNSEVWHLHGRLNWAKCEWHTEIPAWHDPRFQCSFKKPIDRPIQWGDQCPDCGGQLRPEVVWFEEAVHMHESQLKALQQTAHVFIGVGTSATVYPAAGLLQTFRSTPQRYFIDPQPAYEALQDYTILEGTAATQLPRLVRRLLDP